MSILEIIRADSLAARKARDTHKATFLTTLLAEAEKIGKDKGNRVTTDDEVVGVVKKFITNLDDAVNALGTEHKHDQDMARVARRHGLMMEKDYANKYLPAQADTADVNAEVDQLIAKIAPADRNGKAMGRIMGALSQKFGANFDKAAASLYVRTALESQA
ncbi:GatB/YqeY domain-containing protein [Achromobacter xylosoxidans]